MDIIIPFNSIGFDEPLRLTLTGKLLEDELAVLDAVNDYRTKFETKLYNKVTQQLREIRNA